MPWHLLMRRVFAYDVLHCEKCGGRRSVIATIPEGDIAQKILAHLKLPLEAEGFLALVDETLHAAAETGHQPNTARQNGTAMSSMVAAA